MVRRQLSINEAAKGILKNPDIWIGDFINDFIPGYAYEPNYKQHEVNINVAGGETILATTQCPIEPEDRSSIKFINIVDVTLIKQEKDMLVVKSSIDLLTAFYNKQYFIEHYASSSVDIGTEIAVLFVDIDDFKSINDIYGHITGDKVLESIAECVRKSIRSDSKAFRFGGDEFIILFENTFPDDAYQVAEWVRMNVNTLDFGHYVQDMKMSLSIGVANSYMLGTHSFVNLVRKADTAYRSKSEGKIKLPC